MKNDMLELLKLLQIALVIVSCALLLSLFSGCHRSSKINALHISFYRDPVTGVNYVIYYSDHGSVICPRFNADGTLFVEEKEAE